MPPLFPQATCFPIWKANACIVQTSAMTEQKQGEGSARSGATITFIIFEWQLGSALTLFTFLKGGGKKLNLFLLVSKWARLPMELTHFQGTCNYTACSVSVLITPAVLRVCGRPASLFPSTSMEGCRLGTQVMLRRAIQSKLGQGSVKAQRQISPDKSRILPFNYLSKSCSCQIDLFFERPMRDVCLDTETLG